jgi:hypothetical protein
MLVRPLTCALTSGILGIFFSKDRREEVVEVEEDVETASIPEAQQPIPLMTQSQWMKGCPEGGEQGFLFSIYNELSQGCCRCPNKCEFSVPRQKSDFFPILVGLSFVSQASRLLTSKVSLCLPHTSTD